MFTSSRTPIPLPEGISVEVLTPKTHPDHYETTMFLYITDYIGDVLRGLGNCTAATRFNDFFVHVVMIMRTAVWDESQLVLLLASINGMVRQHEQ